MKSLSTLVLTFVASLSLFACGSEPPELSAEPPAAAAESTPQSAGDPSAGQTAAALSSYRVVKVVTDDDTGKTCQRCVICDANGRHCGKPLCCDL